MKEPKTFRKIDYCYRFVDDDHTKTVDCDHKEISSVWYHTKDILVIGKNLVMVSGKKSDKYYVVMISRTTNENESADKIYAPTKPKGGARSHKKNPVVSEDYVPEMVA